MKIGLIGWLLILAASPFAFCEESATSSKQNPPPAKSLFEGDVNGVKYHDEASYKAAASASWEARKQQEINKATTGNYIVNLNGVDYGSAKAFADRDARDKYTYVDKNGTYATYLDNNGNYIPKEQYQNLIRSNMEQTIRRVQTSIDEGIATNAGVTAEDIRNHNNWVASVRSTMNEQIAKVGSSGELLVNGSTEPRVVVGSGTSTITVLGHPGAGTTGTTGNNQGQITVLNNMHHRGGFSSQGITTQPTRQNFQSQNTSSSSGATTPTIRRGRPRVLATQS